MSDRVKVEFEILDPDHTTEEVIRWMRSMLGLMNIHHPKIWVWVPDPQQQAGSLSRKPRPPMKTLPIDPTREMLDSISFSP